MKNIEPGIYPNTHEHIYRGAWGGINQSLLWKLHEKSPAHARNEYLNPRPSTGARLTGTAIHQLVLEPDSLERNFAVRPDGIDGRTREGKIALAEFRASAGTREIVDGTTWDTFAGIRDSVMRHDEALALLTAPGHTELAAVWYDRVHRETMCKMRCDRLASHRSISTILDVKTTEDASPRAFTRSVATWGYHFQAAWYLDGLATIAPGERRFVIMAIEKSAPYEIALYELDFSWLDYGRDLTRKYLDLWVKCEREGVWPGYGEAVEVLDAPDWVLKAMG